MVRYGSEARGGILSPLMKEWSEKAIIGLNAVRPYREKAEENLEFYLGNQLDSGPEPSPVLTNFYYSIMRIMLAAIYADNPRARVKPIFVGDSDPGSILLRKDHARGYEALIMDALKACKMKKQAKKGILSAGLCGRSMMYIGFSAVIGKRTGQNYVTPKTKSKYQVGTPADENSDSEVRSEKVWGRHFSQFNYFYDPAAEEMDESPYLFIDHAADLEEARHNMNFANASKLKPTGTYAESSYFTGLEGFEQRLFNKSGMSHRGIPEHAKKVILRDIYALKDRKVYTYAVGNENLGMLRDTPWPFTKLRGYPAVELAFNPMVDSQWYIPEVSNLRGAQDEVNILDVQTSNFYRRLMNVVLYEEGSMEDEEVEKLMQAEIAEAIKYRRTPPSGFKMPPMSPEFFARRRELNESAERESHLPEWVTSGRSMRTRSATESNAIQQAMSSFVNEKVDTVQEWMGEIYEKMALLMQEAYQLKHVVPVIGELGPRWINFNARDVTEDIDVSIVPYSGLPNTPQMELQKALQTLNLAVSTSQAVPGLVQLPTLLRDVFQKLNPGEDVDAWFNTAMLQQLITNLEVQRVLAARLAERLPEIIAMAQSSLPAVGGELGGILQSALGGGGPGGPGGKPQGQPAQVQPEVTEQTGAPGRPRIA